MTAKPIREDEWRAEFERALKAGQNRPEGLTMQELADALGVNFRTATRRVRLLWEAGKVIVERGMRTSMIGRPAAAYYYRLKPVEPAARKGRKTATNRRKSR